MSKVFGTIFCAVLFCTGTIQAKMNDKEIAREAGAHASKLLAGNLDSEEGLRLFNAAKAIQPDSDNVLLISGFMKRGKAPSGLSTTIDLDQLYQEMGERGIYLLKTQFSHNARIGKLSLLYLRMADAANNKDIDTIKGICYLQAYGFDLSLENLLQEEFDLKDLYAGRDRPSKAWGPKLTDMDEKIIREAIKLAADKLSQDPGSGSGLNLLRFAYHLDPSNLSALTMLQQLQRGITIEAGNSKATLPQMASVMVSQGKHYLKKAESDELSAHLALLYHRVAENLAPDNKDAIIGLMRMEQINQTAQLDDLLETDLAALSGADNLASDDAGSNKDSGTKSEDSDKTASASTIDGSKLKITGDRSMDKDKHDSYYDYGDYTRYTITVDGYVENYIPDDIEGLTIETYIIAEKDRSKTFYLAAKNEQKDVVIKKRGKVNTQPLRATLYELRKGNGSSEFEAWLIVIKDKDGNILNAKASSGKDSFAKNAETVIKFPTITLRKMSPDVYYSYTAPKSGTLFDKDGNQMN